MGQSCRQFLNDNMGMKTFMEKGRQRFNMEIAQKTKPLFNTTRAIIVSFLAVIIVGTILLMFPFASASGEWTKFMDAFFTSTSAVCVVGMTVVPTFAYWSIPGKIIIFILIQLGGLGVICITMGFFILIGRRITLRDRKLIQESFNLDTSSGLVRMILSIFKATFIMEALGAIAYSIRFIPEYGLLKGVALSVFQSVSAFCNCGFDIIGEASLTKYSGDVLVNLTTMILAISGGLGFIVWWDIKNVIEEIRNNALAKNKFIERLPLHSKVVIVASAIFLVAGAILVFVFEYDNPATIGNLPLGEKIMASMFESVTLRSAGFYTFDHGGIRNVTYLIVCIFMLIGGSPMGTAGGIKTSTVAILFIEVMSVVRGKKHAEVFGRRISIENVRTAITVAFISVSVGFMGIIILSITEDASFRQIVFEAFSTIGTAGLSLGITPNLSVVGRLVIIVMMFIGRIGPITMAMAFTARRSKALDRDLPEKRIIIG